MFGSVYFICVVALALSGRPAAASSSADGRSEAREWMQAGADFLSLFIQMGLPWFMVDGNQIGAARWGHNFAQTPSGIIATDTDIDIMFVAKSCEHWHEVSTRLQEQISGLTGWGPCWRDAGGDFMKFTCNHALKKGCLDLYADVHGLVVQDGKGVAYCSCIGHPSKCAGRWPWQKWDGAVPYSDVIANPTFATGLFGSMTVNLPADFRTVASKWNDNEYDDVSQLPQTNICFHDGNGWANSDRGRMGSIVDDMMFWQAKTLKALGFAAYDSVTTSARDSASAPTDIAIACRHGRELCFGTSPLFYAKALAELSHQYTLLREAGIITSLSGGTALGFARLGAPLPNDDDLSLDVWVSNKEMTLTVERVFEDASYSVHRYNRSDDMIGQWTFGKDVDGLRIEFDVFPQFATSQGRLAIFHFFEGKQQRLEHSMFSLTTMTFGGKDYLIPADLPTWASETYGSTWREPQLNFHYTQYGGLVSNEMRCPTEDLLLAPSPTVVDTPSQALGGTIAFRIPTLGGSLLQQNHVHKRRSILSQRHLGKRPD